MPPPSAASSSRALAAILPQIADGHAYEAHQKARTFASRYIKSAQYDTAIDVLFQSSRALLTAGQPGSGTDLALFLIEVYEAKNEVVSEESRGELTQLIALTGSNGTWRKTLIDKAVTWTAKAGPCPAGDPDLNHYVGELLYKDGAFDLAEPHLLAAGKRDSARVLAQMMFEWWHATSVSSSAGPFALRGTIPYLLNGNVLAARTFITHLLSPNPLPVISSSSAGGTDEVIFTTDSLLNFLQLAVRTCQRAQGAGTSPENRKAQEAWVRLCGTYLGRNSVLAQNPIRKHLNELATLFFGLPPPRNQAVNPFGDMLSSLFGGAPSAGAAPRTLTPGPAAAGLD
ncbi:cytoplasmic protein [Fomitiporia mediterranea MF3/22]|uniref:cytoplasmic protein n=1 Tax=Fomitiporia mediterranea (strain MF3/22) TaxID=694068 RepID=UPI0004407418|nr:cytoplasmic protein [Fomitiporia mediterranea MF3/22]EJD06751.1 cytoplasmic protein [Fomitiporia mediterranea MF3/22]